MVNPLRIPIIHVPSCGCSQRPMRNPSRWWIPQTLSIIGQSDSFSPPRTPTCLLTPWMRLSLLFPSRQSHSLLFFLIDLSQEFLRHLSHRNDDQVVEFPVHIRTCTAGLFQFRQGWRAALRWHYECFGMEYLALITHTYVGLVDPVIFAKSVANISHPPVRFI